MISLPCLFDLINAIYNGMTCYSNNYPLSLTYSFSESTSFLFQEKICNKELQNVLFKQIVNVFKKKK